MKKSKGLGFIAVQRKGVILNFFQRGDFNVPKTSFFNKIILYKSYGMVLPAQMYIVLRAIYKKHLLREVGRGFPLKTDLLHKPI